MELISFTIGSVEYHVRRDLQYNRVDFEDGKQLHSTPNYREEDFGRAKALGYREGKQGVAMMSMDHEATHCLLAEACGNRYSPTLYFAAGGPDPGISYRKAEESAVLAIQALANGKPTCDWAEILNLTLGPKTAHTLVEKLLFMRLSIAR